MSPSSSLPLPDGSTLLLSLLPFDPDAFARHCANPPGTVEYLDADRLAPPLLLRPWQPGDSFVPLGAPGRQSVSDFLTNTKVPRPLRPCLLCLCDSEGILWLLDHRLADRVKVTPATRRVLLLRHLPAAAED